MSQPTLNSSLSGINSFNFVGMNRGSGGGRLSYTSLRATSGDNSINEEERLSTPNVHALGGSGSPRGSLTMERSSSRLSQPDVRSRFALRHDKRERLSQPTLVTGDYYPGRVQQRLSQPCLSSGNIGMHFSSSPPPFPLKHKRFGPAVLQVSQRDRLSQLDIGSKYRNIKDLGGGGGGGGGGSSAAQVKFNRDRFSIPELETQNDLRLIAGTPKQRFSLDSQLTKQRFSLDSQDSCKSRLLPIASSPIFEHQQMKTEELMGMTSDRLKSPTCEGLQSVIVASTSPLFPPGERRFLAPDFPFTGRKTSTSPSPPKSEIIPFGKTGRSGKPPPIPVRERMSVPEIRNSSLRRLLDPPARQRHSIAGNLRQSLLSPVKLPEFGTGRKSPRYSIDDALEKLKRIEKEENRRNQEASENKRREAKDQDQQQQQQQEKEPKHIQRHYSYTYETPGSDESGSVSTLGKLSVGGTPKRKFLESNFDENEQVITTVIETEIPMILPSIPGKYAKKAQAYSSETPKWIRKYLEYESPKVGIRKISATGKDQIVRTNRRSSRRKSSLESIESVTKKPEEKARSKSASCEERIAKELLEQKGGIRETYVRIVPSNNAQQENKYEVGVETTAWTKTDGRGLYGDDTDTDDSTSI